MMEQLQKLPKGIKRGEIRSELYLIGIVNGAAAEVLVITGECATLAVDDIAILHIAVIAVAPYVARTAALQLFGYALAIPSGCAVGSIAIVATSQKVFQLSSHT